MTDEAKYLCMGLMQGVYEFEHVSKSEFKDWATDLALGYAENTLEKWRAGKPKPSAITEMRNFIEENLFRWESALKRSLLKRE